jgi:fatty acid desaturase
MAPQGRENPSSAEWILHAPDERIKEKRRKPSKNFGRRADHWLEFCARSSHPGLASAAAGYPSRPRMGAAAARPDPASPNAASRWHRFLRSRSASWLTHGGLALLTAVEILLLLRLPFWLAFVPCALIHHRIGVLLHEYIHGIPFVRYRHNLWVLSLFDGLMLMFGSLDLFRGTHLAHHRWLNTEHDPAFTAKSSTSDRRGAAGWLAALEGVQYLVYLAEVFRGRHPYIVRSRILLGALLSVASIALWLGIGRGDLVWKILLLTAFNVLGPVSLRGAVEHHSHPGDPAFANEYRVWIPLFNLNRHVHHHEDPRCPWYLLQYRTEKPLWTIHYLTHWFHAYVWRDYVLMRPMPASKRARTRRAGSARTESPDEPGV